MFDYENIVVDGGSREGVEERNGWSIYKGEFQVMGVLEKKRWGRESEGE
jgi:hypothetical protein